MIIDIAIHIGIFAISWAIIYAGIHFNNALYLAIGLIIGFMNGYVLAGQRK